MPNRPSSVSLRYATGAIMDTIQSDRLTIALGRALVSYMSPSILTKRSLGKNFFMHNLAIATAACDDFVIFS